MRWLALLAFCSGCGLLIGIDEYRGGTGDEGGSDDAASQASSTQATGAPSSSATGGGGAATSGGGGGGSLKALGESCMSAGECASGHCVDYVCCDLICDGACAKCDASGTCVPEDTTATCGNYHCDGGAEECPGGCDDTSDCAPGFYCTVGNSNTCETDNGSAWCILDSDCSSGDCDGGVCCFTSGCTGLCQSCNDAHTGFGSGFCAFVTTGDPEGDCGPGNHCDGAGQCVADS